MFSKVKKKTKITITITCNNKFKRFLKTRRILN